MKSFRTEFGDLNKIMTGKLPFFRSLMVCVFLLIPLFSGCVQPLNSAGPQVTNQEITPAGTATTEPEPYLTPDWFKDSVVYLVFVRSFYDSDSDGIGDIAGIAEKLDYIQSLGVDTIWLMPIYPSPSEHGYDVTDFTAVNPAYGQIEDMQVLVQAVHDRDMHILLDFVPSHLSNQHPIFQQAYRNPESEYSDWFVWTNETNSQYAGFANLQEMPRFNHYNPEVVDYLVDAAKFWLDLDSDGDYSDGVDGFRIDNATFPPQEFFSELRHRIKEVKPDALLLGETWVNSPSDLSRYFIDQFDALFDFPFYSLLQGNQNFNADGLLAGKSSSVLLSVLVNDQELLYPEQSTSVRFANNHDTNRIATEVDGNLARMKLAPLVTASFSGVPLMYYGEEIGMLGQKGGPPDWDKYRREPMDWYSIESGLGQTTWFKPEDRWNRPGDGISVEEGELDADSLLNYYRRIYQIRAETPVLANGSTRTLDLISSSPGAWGMYRELGDDRLVVLFNFSDNPQQVVIENFPFDAKQMKDLISGQSFPGITAGSNYQINLPATSGLWLIGQDATQP